LHLSQIRLTDALTFMSLRLPYSIAARPKGRTLPRATASS